MHASIMHGQKKKLVRVTFGALTDKFREVGPFG